MFASTWRACASTPPVDHARRSPGSRPTWPASTSQSPARTAGEYGPGRGRCTRCGNGLDRHGHLLRRGKRNGSAERVPGRGRDRGEHRVGRAGARGRGIVDDRHVDRRRLRRAQHAERSDREIVDLAGRRVDREPLARDPARAPCARRRSRRNATRPRRADRRPRARHVDARDLARARPSTVRARARAARRDDVDVAPERARDEHRLLGEPDGAQVGAHRRTGHVDLGPARAHLDRRRRRPHSRRRPRRARRRLRSRRRRRARPRPRRSADASVRAARRLRARTRRAPRARSGRRARARRAGAAECALPPNAPPFASGDAGSPPGSHHDASGSRYAGSTHCVASCTPPGGHARHPVEQRRAARRRSCAGPAPCRRAARASSSDSADDPVQARGLDRVGASNPAGSGTATSASRGAVSSANGAPPSGTSRPTRCGPPASSAARRAGGVEIARRGRRGTDRRRDRVAHRQPTGAPAQVRGQRAVDVARPLAREPHDDARRAEPALRSAGRRRTRRGARRARRRRALRSS